MKWISLTLALFAAGLFLALEKSTAAVLQSELEQRRQEHAELERQRRARERLFALQPTVDELERLQRAVAERAERRRAIEAAEREHREAQVPGLSVGEWLPQTQWQDRGRGTPMATVQTMLWAAFGGDTQRLGNMLHFDESARAKLEQTYAALPASARTTYASPEQLMAAFTAKAIPLGEAQLVWQQQSGPDEAVAFVWVKNPAPTSPRENPEKTVPDPKAPPRLPANPKRSQALLTLRRMDEGWRVVVPAHAVDKLAKELGGPK